MYIFPPVMGVDCYYAVFLLVQLMDCVSRLSIFIILRSGGVSACPGEADQTEPCNNQDCKGKTFFQFIISKKNFHPNHTIVDEKCNDILSFNY